MAPMRITGERTVPGIWHENYWLRRHEAVYESVAGLVGGLDVLEAGCGEGYGAALLSRHARTLHALDYDAYTVGHVRRTYPTIPVVRANLVALPYAAATFDVVVSLQTVEHLWDQDAFVAECVRVLRPEGRLVLSTPNTLTFPPGNPYHPHELDPGGLRALVARHAVVESVHGLAHGADLAAWEQRHGSIVDAQIATSYDDWSETLCAKVAAVTSADFAFVEDNLDASLDLIVIARSRPQTYASASSS